MIPREARTSTPLLAMPGDCSPGLRHVTTALVALVLADGFLRLRGYAALRRWLTRSALHARAPLSDQQSPTALLAAAVDRAAVLYPRQADCLVRSAALVWLLHRNGVRAYLVIGARHTPFYAHSWVEVDGHIVNDRVSVAVKYPEMERV